MVQEPLGSQGLLIIKASRSHSAGLLWMSDQPNAETTTWWNATLTRDRHLCLGGIRTRNLCKQGAAHPGLRMHSDWDRPSCLLLQILWCLLTVCDYFRLSYWLTRDCPDYYAVLSPIPNPEWHFWQTCLQLLWLEAQEMRVFCRWISTLRPHYIQITG